MSETKKPLWIDVCPRCGSDHTRAKHLMGDDAETDRVCTACGLDYQVIQEEEHVAYLYWTDDEGEHTVYSETYLIREAAQTLRDAAQDMVTAHEKGLDLPWGTLKLALRKAKGEFHESA